MRRQGLCAALAVLAAFWSAAACARLPAWMNPDFISPPPDAGEVVVYPDLRAIPDRPANPPAAEQEEAVQSLAADGARTVAAGDDLEREIEDDFTFPEPATAQ